MSEYEKGRYLGRIIFFLVLVLTFGIGVGAYTLVGATISIPFLSEKNPTGKKIVFENAGSVALAHSSYRQTILDLGNVFGKISLKKGEVSTVTFTEDPENSGASLVARTRVLLLALSAGAPPEEFLHSLDEPSTYGIYSTPNFVGFLKLHTRSYSETFAGMLDWEKTLGDDLAVALNPNMKGGESDALHGRMFHDERIAETNARVLNDPDGRSVVAYAFPDQDTLIIAGSKEALGGLIERSRTAGR